MENAVETRTFTPFQSQAFWQMISYRRLLRSRKILKIGRLLLFTEDQQCQLRLFCS